MPDYDRSEFIGAATADVEKGTPKAAYVHKDWPALRYGPNGAEKKVANQAEADKLGPNWFKTPPLPEKDDDEAGPARAAEVRTKAAAPEAEASAGKKTK